MPLVKLTIFPEPRDIPAEEIPVLRSQGLIEDEDPAAAEGTDGAAEDDDQDAGEPGTEEDDDQ